MPDLTPFSDALTFLYTHDLEKTDDFYSNILGLKLVLDQGTCRIYHASGSGYIGFCERASAPDGLTDFLIFTLVTQDVDSWAAHLVEQGVSLEKTPTLNAQYDIYHCFFRDPNGYLLEIQRFNNPAWNTTEELHDT